MSVAADLHAAAAAGFGASLCSVPASAVCAFVVEGGVGLGFEFVVVHGHPFGAHGPGWGRPAQRPAPARSAHGRRGIVRPPMAALDPLSPRLGDTIWRGVWVRAGCAPQRPRPVKPSPRSRSGCTMARIPRAHGTRFVGVRACSRPRSFRCSRGLGTEVLLSIVGVTVLAGQTHSSGVSDSAAAFAARIRYWCVGHATSRSRHHARSTSCSTSRRPSRRRVGIPLRRHLRIVLRDRFTRRAACLRVSQVSSIASRRRNTRFGRRDT